MVNVQRFSEEKIYQVIKAYLVEVKSHRYIQENILDIEAPIRGGGFVAMQILHHYGIHGNKKGILMRNSLKEEYSGAENQYKLALEIMKKSL